MFVTDRMSGFAESTSTDVRISGGFRIEISPQELIVTKTGSSAVSTLVLLAVLALGALLSDSSLVYSAIVVSAVLIGWYLSGVDHNLRCTRERLEVLDVFQIRAPKTRTYPCSDVKQIAFSAVSFSKYGSINGLAFEACGKRVKMLYGLKSVEAKIILDELERLGFDVFHDVAMPMMIEMEQSRRKSWIGRWFS